MRRRVSASPTYHPQVLLIYVRPPEQAASGINYHRCMVPFRKIFGPTKRDVNKILKSIEESGALMRPEIGRREGRIPELAEIITAGPTYNTT